MELLLVLLFVALAAASPIQSVINDDILNEHAHNFMSVRRTVIDKNDAFDNLDALELVRSLAFCSRNGVERVGPCMAVNFREGKAAPRMMNRFVQKTLNSSGLNITLYFDFVEDGTIRCEGQDYTWIFDGNASYAGTSLPYQRKGSFHGVSGSWTFSEGITSSGDHYQADMSYSVHVDLGLPKDNNPVHGDVIISVSLYGRLTFQSDDGSITDSERIGQGTAYLKIKSIQTGSLVTFTVPTTASSTVEDVVTIQSADGSIIRTFGDSTTYGGDILEVLNVTLTHDGLVHVSSEATFESLAAHMADQPDVRYSSKGSARSAASLTLAPGKMSVAGHNELEMKTDLSDYQDTLLLVTVTKAESDNQVCLTVEGDADKSADLEVKVNFSGKTVAIPENGSGTVTVANNGTFTGTVTAKDNGDNTAQGHTEQHLKVNIQQY